MKIKIHIILNNYNKLNFSDKLNYKFTVNFTPMTLSCFRTLSCNK